MLGLRRAVLVVAVLAAGCGGGGDDTASFTDRGNQACTKRAELAKRGDAKFENRAYVEAYRRETAALRKLDPPAEQRDAFARLLDLYAERDRTSAETDDLIKRMRASGSSAEYDRLRDRFDRVIQANNRARVQGNRTARELGLKTCGQDFS